MRDRKKGRNSREKERDIERKRAREKEIPRIKRQKRQVEERTAKMSLGKRERQRDRKSEIATERQKRMRMCAREKIKTENIKCVFAYREAQAMD